jgi:riboflavin biosynthesis pyrimidine reductase
MMALFPQANSQNMKIIDVVRATERQPHQDLPWLLTNTVLSLEGRYSPGGTSKLLSSPKDQDLLIGFRSAADAIIVGAKTVVSERYGVPKDTLRATGSKRPQIVIVSKHLNLPLDLPLFGDAGFKPLIATTIDANVTPELEERCEVVRFGEDQVDLIALFGYLRSKEFKVVVCEGGPNLNSQLIELNLVDEWNLTISPKFAGTAPDASVSKEAQTNKIPLQELKEMQLENVWQSDAYLFCRWLRKEKQSTKI